MAKPIDTSRKGLTKLHLGLVTTRNEALQAAHLLQRYMGTLNDPFVRNLELLLGAFGQRTCTKGLLNTTGTKITSSFPCKAQRCSS
ncbi:hypothetical protein BKA83DRAFT_4279749 [Pisolithus microcarpus]|nr:hypothetical protein BKA83DRAFT_4279749 [Pisolithus microcarpus]